MNTASPPDLTRLQNRFIGGFAPRFDSGSEAVNQVWDDTRNGWFTRQNHFHDAETLSDWLTGAAPTDSSPSEVCQHYL